MPDMEAPLTSQGAAEAAVLDAAAPCATAMASDASGDEVGAAEQLGHRFLDQAPAHPAQARHSSSHYVL